MRVSDFHGKTVYLDSNVFIYAFEGQAGPASDVAGLVLRDASAGALVARTSLIARAEALVRPMRLRQTELTDRYRMLLSGAAIVSVYAIDEAVVELSAELRADYTTLKLVDAIHIATAIRTGCEAFVTGDRRLGVAAARIRVVLLDDLVEGPTGRSHQPE